MEYRGKLALSVLRNDDLLAIIADVSLPSDITNLLVAIRHVPTNEWRRRYLNLFRQLDEYPWIERMSAKGFTVVLVGADVKRLGLLVANSVCHTPPESDPIVVWPAVVPVKECIENIATQSINPPSRSWNLAPPGLYKPGVENFWLTLPKSHEHGSKRHADLIRVSNLDYGDSRAELRSRLDLGWAMFLRPNVPMTTYPGQDPLCSWVTAKINTNFHNIVTVFSTREQTPENSRHSWTQARLFPVPGQTQPERLSEEDEEDDETVLDYDMHFAPPLAKPAGCQLRSYYYVRDQMKLLKCRTEIGVDSQLGWAPNLRDMKWYSEQDEEGGQDGTQHDGDTLTFFLQMTLETNGEEPCPVNMWIPLEEVRWDKIVMEDTEAVSWQGLQEVRSFDECSFALR